MMLLKLVTLSAAEQAGGLQRPMSAGRIKGGRRNDHVCIGIRSRIGGGLEFPASAGLAQGHARRFAQEVSSSTWCAIILLDRRVKQDFAPAGDNSLSC